VSFATISDHPIEVPSARFERMSNPLFAIVSVMRYSETDLKRTTAGAYGIGVETLYRIDPSNGQMSKLWMCPLRQRNELLAPKWGRPLIFWDPRLNRRHTHWRTYLLNLDLGLSFGF
jgi:hypothetical protein